MRIANISYFSKSEIWLDKILVNVVHFVKFASQIFALYTVAAVTLMTVVLEYTSCYREMWIRFAIKP